jgi:hypothetical protein
MTYTISVVYKDESEIADSIEANSLDQVMFSLIGSRSGISTHDVAYIAITLIEE